MKKVNTGFTLIELVVAMVIFLIVASVAIPNYKTYVLKSRRLEGQANLLKIQAVYEEYFAQNNTYPPVNTLPPLAYIPSTTYYSYTSNTTSTTYSVKATAIGGQAADKEGTTACQIMTIDNQGLLSPSDCWAK